MWLALRYALLWALAFVASPGRGATQLQERPPWQGAVLLKDNRGCSAWQTPAGQSIESTVPCVAGRFHGVGRTQWRDAAGVTYWVLSLTPQSGLMWNNGKVVLSYAFDRIQTTLLECEPRNTWRRGITRIPDGAALEMDWLRDSILATALRQVAALCPTSPLRPDRGEVTLIWESSPVRIPDDYSKLSSRERGAFHMQLAGAQFGYGPTNQVLVLCINDDRGQPRINCAPPGTPRFPYYQAQQMLLASLAGEDNNRIKVAREVAEETARRSAAAAAQARRTNALRVVGANMEASWRDLAVNPYQFQGKVVALRAQFEAMSSATSARFGGGGLRSILVTGVPSTKFLKQDWFLLSLTGVELRSGVLTARYSASLQCAQDECRELAPPPGG